MFRNVMCGYVEFEGSLLKAFLKVKETSIIEALPKNYVYSIYTMLKIYIFEESMIDIEGFLIFL